MGLVAADEFRYLRGEDVTKDLDNITSDNGGTAELLGDTEKEDD